MGRDHGKRMSEPSAFLLLLLSALVLSGCHGTLELWQLGALSVDDDDGPPPLDYSAFEGVEFVNIDWDQEAWPQGVDDCRADWHALGNETTGSDQELCPSCAHIWTVQLSYLGTEEDCLQGTALPLPSDISLHFGFEFLAELPSLFTVWRGTGDGAMIEVGIGAIDADRSEFTWSGQESYRNDGEIIGYEWFLSGAGSF